MSDAEDDFMCDDEEEYDLVSQDGDFLVFRDGWGVLDFGVVIYEVP